MDNNTATSLKTTKNRLNVNILLLFPAIKSTDLCTRGRLRMLGFERCFDNALYYTYGAGAVDPVEPVNWGLIDLEGYQTQVAGQGNASINNVDVI